MQKVELTCIENCVDMCMAAWRLGWHEFHAGNISYRLTEAEKHIALENANASQAEWHSMPLIVPSLGGECFLVSSAGSGFRQLDTAPEKYLGIVELNVEGSAWRCLWGLEGSHPTSEFPAHLMNHEIKRRYAGDKYHVIYHAHPTNLIALSFVLPLEDAVFTRELWEMEPECAMTFPNGIGVLPWVMPGSEQSASATGEKMRDYDVVLWAYHGAFCAGEDFEKTLGVMHTVEKSAEILVKTLAIGGKRQYPSADNLRNLKEPFRLDLPERFLFKK